MMTGSKENPPMAIMGDYPIKVLGYKFGHSFLFVADIIQKDIYAVHYKSAFKSYITEIATVISKLP